MSDVSTIIVERAVKADLPTVVDLCMAVEAQHEGYWPLRWERRKGLPEGYLGWLTRRLDDPRMLIGVARIDGELAGMILITIEQEVPIYTYTHYAFVQDMATVEKFRRRGVAQKLLDYAADWAKGQGLNQLRLLVANQNPAARATFDAAGFRATYQEMVRAV